MKIRVRTITNASLWVATSVAVVSLVWALVLRPEWYCIAAIVASTFLISLLVAAYAFRMFVLFRIKPMYQILLSKNTKIRELRRTRGIVESMEKELNSWVERNDEKINRLREKEKYRKEFLGDVSHELKTPIFNIQGYITTLLDGGLEDKTINRKYLERAEKSIDRLINIVEDLGQISRMESNNILLDKKNFDMVRLTREIADDVEMMAARQNTDLRIGTGESQPPVMVHADRDSIAQVMTNLMVNAVKYGKKGGGSVKVGFIDGFDKVIVEVADNGVGIPEEYTLRVFERFFRVDKSRSREQGGTGLGLAIVKHYLEAHGQSITVRSKPGEGTTFSFTLEKAKQ